VTDLRNGENASVVNKVTTDNQPVIIGIGTAGASVAVYANGKKIGTATVDGSGSWSMEPSKALANGPEAISAVVTGKSDLGAPALQTTIWASGPTVNITLPVYADAQAFPTISVNITNAPYGYDPNIHYDVKFAGDSDFTNDYLVTTDTNVTFWSVTRGTDSIRVRVTDTLGNVGVGTADMPVDPWAGYVGSSDLLKLATGWDNSPYNAPNSVPGAWGLGGLNGGSGGGGAGGSGQGGPGQPGGGNLGGIGGVGGAGGGFDSSSSAYKRFYIDSQNRVMIDAHAILPKYFKDFQQELTNLGIAITAVSPKDLMVEGYLPINEIMALNSTPYFSAATPVMRADTNAGPGAEQGDAVIGGPDFRTSTGADGTGINVGIISDSVNEFNGGIADSIAARALPKGGVTVLEDMPNGPGTDEGRAMAEIVHKVALGAGLGFHTGGNGILDMVNGIYALQHEFGANVIVDDITFPDSPLFSVGRIGQAADAVYSQGLVYVTSAGNNGNSGWRAPWNGESATVGTVTGEFMNFGMGTPLQTFTLQPGDTLSVDFFWDAAYQEGGSAAPLFQVPNNVVAYVLDAVTGNIVLTANTQGQNTNEAYQAITYTNSTTDSRFEFAFQLQSGPAPQEIGWVDEIGHGSPEINAQHEGAPTMQGQALASGVLSTGAVNWLTPTKPEMFSALGGQLQLFSDDFGNRFAGQHFISKPDVAGPDNVGLSFDLGGATTFQGTSAAAPHVAGAAALLESQNQLMAASTPVLNPLTQQEPLSGIVDNVEIDRFLRVTTTSRLVPGFDAQLGEGVIHLQMLNYYPTIYEVNDSSDQAFMLGAAGSSKMVITAEIGDSYFGLPDQDWYAISPTAAGAVNIIMDNPDLTLNVYTFSTDPLSGVTVGFTTDVPSGTTFAAGSLVLIQVLGTSTTPVTSNTGVYNVAIELDPPGVVQNSFAPV
jgi:hypothetical protein